MLVLAVCSSLKLYGSIWEYASYIEVIRGYIACFVLGVLQVIGTILLTTRMPISYYLIGWLLMFILLVGIRMSYRGIRFMKIFQRQNDASLERVRIVGGGEAGRMIIRELRVHVPLRSIVICIADDAPGKQGRRLEGIPVRGTIPQVPELVRKYNIDRIIIAIPSASGKRRKEIISNLKSAECEIDILPRFSDRFNGQVNLGQVRKVSAEDLLGREPVRIDNSQVGEMLKGKTVMVTGGGGSIGSELVEQIAGYEPEKLIIFDIYENNAYDIQHEMISKYPSLKLETLIGSVRDEKRIRHVIEKYRPDAVFHAAAHKHVPLMETAPCEAIKNNVKGTYHCAKAASDFGVKRFLLISTDKAVNPTNIMGASKRLCEMVVKAMDEQSDTEFVTVRFGNVLGSNGSVIPLFKKQISAGGPVTVTHPDITRFFMTIPEAVSLVLQCGAYARGGELYVLDMGEPVKIDTLARNLIELAGLVPDVDIKIEYVGLRPGEKLYEELLMEEEDLGKTDNKLIYIGKQSEPPDDFFEKLMALDKAAKENPEDIIDRVAELVTSYTPQRDN
ncbi:MAG: nucleoside-diphosphate sugar epimerase/dehydratase [Eubacteriales bacterium]|nr:nucleoside-diphosphate sugar epimerase/dehydratase [Eubacteriales bacterium]